MNTEKLQKTVSERIRGMCKEKEISYYQLAYESEVPMTTLMNILNCRTQKPGLSTIIKLCDTLDVSLAEFFDTKEFLALVQEVGE